MREGGYEGRTGAGVEGLITVETAPILLHVRKRISKMTYAWNIDAFHLGN